MEFFLLTLLLIALAVISYVVIQRARLESRLHRLCSRLRWGKYIRIWRPGSWWRRQEVYEYQGEFRNRRITIRYFCPSILPDQTSHFSRWRNGELEMEIPVLQKFWLRLLTENYDSPSADEIEIGDEALDSHYLIHTNFPQAAEEFLLSPEVQRQFETLHYLFSRMEVYQGRWKILFPPNVVETMTAHDMERMVDAVEQIIHAYELHLPLKIITVPKSTLCPYCRNELNANQESVLACTQCGTTIHEACWEENGQCTTWGCTSTHKRSVANGLTDRQTL